MYTLYKFHFLNGISEINQLFDDILIIWPAPVYEEGYARDNSLLPGGMRDQWNLSIYQQRFVFTKKVDWQDL